MQNFEPWTRSALHFLHLSSAVTGEPHFAQNIESGGRSAEHLRQRIVTTAALPQRGQNRESEPISLWQPAQETLPLGAPFDWLASTMITGRIERSSPWTSAGVKESAPATRRLTKSAGSATRKV